MSDLWVFGYGSLMWRPGFPFEETCRARLAGYARQLCISSIVYRGSCDRPGLVFGLDHGGVCDGVAFRISAEHNRSALAYLHQRELVTGAYRVRRESAALMDGSRRQVMVLCFVADRRSRQYAGGLPITTQAEIVRTSRGQSGSNLAYFASTLQHLVELGIRDRALERLAGIVGVRRLALASATEDVPRRVAVGGMLWRRALLRRLPPPRALACPHFRTVAPRR